MHRLFSFENRVAQRHAKQVWGELCLYGIMIMIIKANFVLTKCIDGRV